MENNASSSQKDESNTNSSPKTESDTDSLPKNESNTDSSLKKESNTDSSLEKESNTDSSSKKEKKQKRSSFDFISWAKEKTTISDSSSEKPKKKGTVLKNLAALEKELRFDSIYKRAQSIFTPDELQKSEEGDQGDKVEETKWMIERLSPAMTTVFIVSATTGSAMPSLPYALKQSSWFGVFLLCVCGFNTLYATLCIGWSWTMLEERWPEYEEDTRIPYQDIAYRAIGSWMKYIVAIVIDINLLGTCAVYMLLVSGAIERVAVSYFGFCPTFLVTVAILTPFTWFGYYRNMKFIGICDAMCSALFAILLLVALFLEKPFYQASTYTDPPLDSVGLAFAEFAFAYGAGAVFPSVMADMTDRNKFAHSCGTGFIILLVIYVSIPILGYAAYGDDTPKSIIVKFLGGKPEIYGLGYALTVLYVVQICTTFVISLTPTLHAFEERFNCPTNFGIRRILIRVAIMVFLLLLGLGVPYLPKFLNIVGATTMNLLSFIFPVVFYACLALQKNEKYPARKISKKEWFWLIEIVLLGIVGGIISTYVALKNIANLTQVQSSGLISCYENFTLIMISERY